MLEEPITCRSGEGGGTLKKEDSETCFETLLGLNLEKAKTGERPLKYLHLVLKSCLCWAQLTLISIKTNIHGIIKLDVIALTKEF